MLSIEQLVEKAALDGASDIHLIRALPPKYRLDGQLQDMAEEPLTEEDCFSYARVLAGERYPEFEEEGELDAAGSFAGTRCRIHVFRQQGTPSVALRLLKDRIPALETLGLPPAAMPLTDLHKGIVLVTGETGSGKSTTLAALLDRINHTRRDHIVTLEDPVEYIYTPDRCAINQREIGRDTKSFASGLRASLREDPDVILVGEMRDLETISTAITAAETGHLVFSTLHTNSAAATINRIIDVFPEGQKEQLRTQLSMVLETVVSQRLVPKADGSGRVACFEVMHSTDAIRNNIRGNKIFQIANTMQTSRKEGMITMDEALAEALAAGLITRETALEYAENPDAVEKGSARAQESTEKKYSW